ncbi:MAG: glycosyltransferase family 4 protein [Candidatus Nitrosoglobus sp.]|jgi:glycosyltransferase involved in cell wall biosynthesis
MILAEREILVDTYNLRLEQGSGIKTYGLSLINALSQSKAQVSLLTDQHIPKSRYSILDEVHLFDRAINHTPPYPRLWKAIQMLSHAGRTLAAAPIEISRVIPFEGSGLGPLYRCYNLPELYDIANHVYLRLGRLTQVRLPKPPAIWHATTPVPIRIRGAQMVTTVHDLIPLRLPYTTLDNKKFFYRLVRDALRDSELVLTISESSKQDILAFYDIPEDRIVVTYQALPPKLVAVNKRQSFSLLKSYGLTPGRYVLFVGNIEPKKNLATLIKAMSMLQHEIPLVVVGRKAWLWEEQLEAVKRYLGGTKSKRFQILDYVPSAVLNTLYSHALCLAFPSLYEGFGLPPLEAMRHGCPVICSNVSSLPEVCGEAALYIDPYDPDGLYEHIESLIEDVRLRAQLIEAGYNRVEHFSLDRYTDRLCAAYSKILD